MQDEIGLRHLFERRAKRRDQGVRQPIDEPDRVRHEQLAAVGQAHLTHQGVERHEERVGGLRVGARQHIEERRLARVGVADERNRRHRRLVAPLAQLRAPAPHLLDVFADHVDARPDPAPVGFELGLARSPRPDAAAEARERGAGADQPRQQVFQLRQLHLQLAFARPGAARENVENELRAVDDLAADLLFDLPQLRRRELVVEDHDVDAGLGARRGQRRHLARTEKRRRIGLGPLLQHAQHDLGAGGFGQPRELLERAFGFHAPGAAGDQPDKRRPLGARHPRCAHASTASHETAPGRTSRGSSPVTSTIVEGGPPRVLPASSSRSIRVPIVRSTSSDRRPAARR